MPRQEFQTLLGMFKRIYSIFRDLKKKKNNSSSKKGNK